MIGPRARRRRASGATIRVEQLQVSRKGPADFGSMADSAPSSDRRGAASCPPGLALTLEEASAIEGDPESRASSSPARRHSNSFTPAPFAISMRSRIRARSGASEITQARATRCRRDLLGEKGRAPAERAPLRSGPARPRRRTIAPECVAGPGISTASRDLDSVGPEVAGSAASARRSRARLGGGGALRRFWRKTSNIGTSPRPPPRPRGGASSLLPWADSRWPRARAAATPAPSKLHMLGRALRGPELIPVQSYSFRRRLPATPIPACR